MLEDKLRNFSTTQFEQIFIQEKSEIKVNINNISESSSKTPSTSHGN
jgi:hypothetical protein